MTSTTIPLIPTLARKRVLMANDAIPGLLLLINGLGALGEESIHGQFAYLNIAAGVAVIAALLYELKQGNKASHKIVSWFDVIAGMVLIVEAANRRHAGRIFQPAIFFFLLGLFTIVRGIFHNRFPAFRRLVVNDKGFNLRVNIFRRLQLTWEMVESATMEGEILSIKTHYGKTHNFNLSRVENRGEVFLKLSENIYPKL